MVDRENEAMGGASDDRRERRVGQELESRHGDDIVAAETVEFKNGRDAIRAVSIMSAEIESKRLTLDRTRRHRPC
jgi:hypothetical protein